MAKFKIRYVGFRFSSVPSQDIKSPKSLNVGVPRGTLLGPVLHPLRSLGIFCHIYADTHNFRLALMTCTTQLIMGLTREAELVKLFPSLALS